MASLGLGCARLGGAGGGSGRSESVRLVRSAVDLGVTYFDTADAYGAGASERILGEVLQGRTADVVIATKGGYRFRQRSAMARRARTAAAGAIGRLRAVAPQRSGMPSGSSSGYAEQDFSPAYLTTALDASLRRLGTDHVDVYQLHGPRQVDRQAAAEWAVAMMADGKFATFGIGAEDLDQARSWLGCDVVSSVQIPFGLLDPEALDDVIPAARASGCSVVARGVLGAGLLEHPEMAGRANAHKLPLIHDVRSIANAAGVSVASLAIGYVRACPQVETILVGTRSATHLGELVMAMAGPPVDGSLLATVESAVAKYRRDRRDH